MVDRRRIEGALDAVWSGVAQARPLVVPSGSLGCRVAAVGSRQARGAQLLQPCNTSVLAHCNSLSGSCLLLKAGDEAVEVGESVNKR